MKLFRWSGKQAAESSKVMKIALILFIILSTLMVYQPGFCVRWVISASCVLPKGKR